MGGFEKKAWVNDEVIEAASLNRMEDGISEAIEAAEAAKETVESIPAGGKGDPGASVAAIELEVDAEGRVTGGTATLSNSEEVNITVTTKE